MSQLGIHHHEQVGALIYLDALNDLGDDWTDYDALTTKLPEVMQKGPSPSPSFGIDRETSEYWIHSAMGG